MIYILTDSVVINFAFKIKLYISLNWLICKNGCWMIFSCPIRTVGRKNHLDSFCFVVQNALIMYGWTNIKWYVNSEPESVRFISRVGNKVL